MIDTDLDLRLELLLQDLKAHMDEQTAAIIDDLSEKIDEAVNTVLAKLSGGSEQ